MPKTGLSDEEWNNRLHDYAAGTFKFDPKHRRPPPSNKTWYPKLALIDTCTQKAKLIKDQSGNISFGDPKCTCGFHQQIVNSIS